MNEQLEKIAKFFNTDNVVSNEEMQQAIDAIAQVLLTFKQATAQINQDTQRQLGELMSKVEEAYQRNVGEVSMAQLEQAIADVRSKVDEVMAMRPQDGRDGIDGRDGKNGKDGRDGRDGKNGSPDTAEQIKGKLETLKGDARLDASAIKNLPEATQTVVREMTLGQVETPLKAGTGITITKDATGAKVITSTASGTGTVTDVSVTTANGVSGSVANSTTTPAITLTLGAITPTSVNGVTISGSATPTLAVTGTTAVSGTNTGDQDISGKASTALDNLASVAINTTLASDTDNTDDLGTTLKKWANIFVTNIGATATRVTKGWFTDIESTNMPTVGGTAILTSLTAPQFTTIELGHATDTTLSRVSAGVVAVEGNNVLTTATGLPLSGGTMTGNITLGENTAIALDPAGSADGKYSGITVTGTSGYSQAFGDLVYLDPTDSRWEAVDANAASGADGDARGMLGIVVSTGTDGNACTILLNGIVRADAKFPTFTVNNPIYASETAGAVTQTQPTTTDVVIRQVGSALTADEMYFNPDWDWITHI